MHGQYQEWVRVKNQNGSMITGYRFWKDLIRFDKGLNLNPSATH